MKLSIRLFKSFATKLLFGSSLIATSLLTFGVQPSKADFAPNNDQIWAFELANGQRANLPSSQRSTSGRFYSWPADSSGDQNFVLSSDGNGWNIRHTPSGFMMTSPTTTPNSNGATQLVPQSGGYNTAQTFDFVDTGAGNNTFNIKFRANPAYCVNVPFGQQNKILNLWPCSNTDPTQVFKGVYLGGNPTYVAPMTNGSTGYLESANGYRISMPATGANAQLPVVSPNDSDPYQKFTFSTNGSAYMFTRTGTASGISSSDLNFINLNGGSMGAVAYPNTGGRYAGFNFVSSGSGWYQIKHFFYPQYCLNAAPPVANIVPCNSNASSQRFRMSGQTVTYQDAITPYYYAVIASGGSVTPSSVSQTGHTWSAVFKLTKNERKKFINGIYDSTQVSYTSDKTTLSAWEGFNPVPIINKTDDIGWLTGYIDGTPNTGFTYRLKTIALQTYANAINSYVSQTGCVGYAAIRTSPGEQTCNCTRASVNFWSLVTGETVTGVMTPGSVQQSILNSQNNQSILFSKP